MGRIKTYGVQVWNGEQIKGDLRKYNLIGLDRAAEVIEVEVRERCPVGPTGNLRASVRRFVDEENLTSFVNAGDDRAWYAPLVERGTANARPHPFVRPAFDSKARAAQAAHAAEVRKALR